MNTKAFDAIFGQSKAIGELKDLLADRHKSVRNRVYLLHGPTGTGKSTCADAIADYLGFDPFWGVSKIGSSEILIDTLRERLGALHQLPSVGEGKILILDEADIMPSDCIDKLKTAIESIPENCLLVMTTNHPEKFPDTFQGRFKRIEFPGNKADLESFAQGYWTSKGGQGRYPKVGKVIFNGSLSFRALAGALDDALSKQKGDKLRGDAGNAFDALVEEVKPEVVEPREIEILRNASDYDLTKSQLVSCANVVKYWEEHGILYLCGLRKFRSKLDLY